MSALDFEQYWRIWSCGREEGLREAREAGVECEKTRCRYPDCVDNEDEKCSRWLSGECEGPREEEPSCIVTHDIGEHPVTVDVDLTLDQYRDLIDQVGRIYMLAAVEWNGQGKGKLTLVPSRGCAVAEDGESTKRKWIPWREECPLCGNGDNYVYTVGDAGAYDGDAVKCGFCGQRGHVSADEDGCDTVWEDT